jgi:hypothetical protein
MKYIKRNRISEANIQAELYCKLLSNDIQCELEYKIKGIGVIDIIILDNPRKKILCFIECKSYKRPTTYHNDTTQLRRYRTCDVPVLLIGRLEKIDDIVQQVKEIVNNNQS